MQKAKVFFHKYNYTILRIPRKELHTCTPINVIDASYTTEKLYANESRKSCSGVTVSYTHLTLPTILRV